jgi:hypothetical protein
VLRERERGREGRGQPKDQGEQQPRLGPRALLWLRSERLVVLSLSPSLSLSLPALAACRCHSLSPRVIGGTSDSSLPVPAAVTPCHSHHRIAPAQRKGAFFRNGFARLQSRFVIAEPDLLPLILESFPSFGPIWERRIAIWGDREPPGSFIPAFELAFHMAKPIARGDLLELPAFSAFLERLLEEGSVAVREVATRGMLEDLISFDADGLPLREPLLAALGPKAKAAFLEIDADYGQWLRQHPRRRR